MTYFATMPNVTRTGFCARHGPRVHSERSAGVSVSQFQFIDEMS